MSNYNYTTPEYWDDKLPNLSAALRNIKNKKMKQIEELTEDDLMAIWPVIGGSPHLFEYGKDELKNVIVTGDLETENKEGSYEVVGLTLDFYTMAAIVDILRSRGYETPKYI